VVILAEQVLEDLAWNDPDRRSLTGLLAALRTGGGMLAECRQWRESQPKFARALLAVGCKHRERLEMLLTNYLVMPEARNAA